MTIACGRQSIDFETKQLVFEGNEGSNVEEQYDLLIAADGARSFVRQKLQQYDSTFEVKSFQHYGSFKVMRDLPFLGEDGKLIFLFTANGYRFVSLCLQRR